MKNPFKQITDKQFLKSILRWFLFDCRGFLHDGGMCVAQKGKFNSYTGFFANIE